MGLKSEALHRSTATRASAWLAHADPAGLLYGAVISAGTLATVSTHADGATFVGVATAVVLGVYWMAHVYIETLSRQLAGDTHGFLVRVGHACGHETSVLTGGSPAVAVYTVGSWCGLSVGSAASLAVYFSVVLLGSVGYLGARRAGRRGRQVAVEVAGAASFGMLIVAAKTLLH